MFCTNDMYSIQKWIFKMWKPLCSAFKISLQSILLKMGLIFCYWTFIPIALRNEDMGNWMRLPQEPDILLYISVTSQGLAVCLIFVDIRHLRARRLRKITLIWLCCLTVTKKWKTGCGVVPQLKLICVKVMLSVIITFLE